MKKETLEEYKRRTWYAYLFFAIGLTGLAITILIAISI